VAERTERHVSSIVQDAVAGIGRGEGPIDERPLNEDERKMVARLLSDPFAFPQTFKTWLVAFLESSDLTLPISSINGLSSTLGIGGEGNTSFIKGLLPAGTIMGWGSARIPNGCLRCDGVAYSRTAYGALFREIGTSWGAGDGSTTFNVPDFRRRFPLGVGSTGFGLNASDNLPESQRTPDHHHTVSVSGETNQEGQNHTHGQPGGGAAVSPGSGLNVLESGGGGWPATYGVSNSHTHGFNASGSTSGGGAQDHPAFLAIHFIIVT
jgi:microcystin-dependent protein